MPRDALAETQVSSALNGDSRVIEVLVKPNDSKTAITGHMEALEEVDIVLSDGDSNLHDSLKQGDPGLVYHGNGYITIQMPHNELHPIQLADRLAAKSWRLTAMSSYIEQEKVLHREVLEVFFSGNDIGLIGRVESLREIVPNPETLKWKAYGEYGDYFSIKLPSNLKPGVRVKEILLTKNWQLLSSSQYLDTWFKN